MHFKFCKVVKVVVVSFYSCHYLACLYVSFGKATGDRGDLAEDDVWKIRDHSEEGHHRLPTEYFAALFWSLGLVSKCLEGEIPRTLLQSIFMAVVTMGGFLLFVYICGTLFMISKCDANSAERFDAKLNQLRYVLSFHHVPHDIQERAMEFLESGDANDRNTMKLLCPSIAKDVKFTLLKSMVANVPFFKCCNAAFTRALIDLMETQSLPTNYLVCSKGEQGEEMYFVQSGVLAVLINEIKVRELRKGGFFGELSLFTNQVRTANVVTSTFCIVHKLSRSHVRRVLRAYPQFETQILACVKALLQEMDLQNDRVARRRVSSMRPETVTKRAQAYENFVKKDLGGGGGDQGSAASSRRMGHRFVDNILVSPTSNDIRPAGHATTLYNVFMVALLNTFQLLGYPVSILVLNTLADVVLYLDIYGKFNLSFVEEAEQIMDTAKCARHYLHKSFYFDVVCALPLWVLYPHLHLKFRFARMLRFYTFNDELEEVSLFIRINSRRRIFVLGVGLFLCYHIAGCMAHSLVYVMGFDASGHGWLPPKSLQLEPIINATTGDLVGYDYMDGARFVAVGDPFVHHIVLEQYFRALQYGAVCLTNLGRTLEPENLWEFILAFVLMLCGMLLISIIIDEVQKRVTASAIEQMEFLSTRSRILHFLQKQKAPLDMHRRVSSYLDFWWSAHRGANINELLGELPNSLQREIYRFVCSPVLDVIQRMDKIGGNIERVTGLLLDNLVIHLYGQGEVIYRRGDSADTLFILLVGQCGVGHNPRSSATRPVRALKHGDFFGVSSLELDNENVVHSDQALARSACVIAMVSRSTLLLIDHTFPTFCSSLLHREIKRFGEHRAMSKLLDPQELVSMGKTKMPAAINPDSNFSLFWETLLFFGMVFQSIGVPFYMAFGFSEEGIGPSDGISILLETCFLADIVLKTRTGYDYYGNKVMDVVRIRQRYLRSLNFFIDVMAVMPLNLVNISRATRSEAWNINKLLRLFKLSSQIEHLERHYYTINIQIRVFKLVFYIYLLAHYIGCMWYNFASNASTFFGFIQETQFGHDPWLPGKKLDLNNTDHSTFWKYSHALYWGLGLLLGFEPGQFPETVLEYMYTMIVQTIGVFLLAYVVGNLLDIVQVMEGNNREFFSNLNYVRKLIKYFDFTPDVQAKIQHFYFYRLFHSIHEEHVLAHCLAPSLVADIRLFLLTPMLNKVPFFRDENANSTVTRSLVRLLSQILVTRGEVVCRQNEIGVEMYFIFTGCLEVFVATTASAVSDGFHEVGSPHRGLKVNELQAGSFFGEKSLFSDQPRNASIQAKTFCTLYRLSRKHLESVFVQHPEWKGKVMDIVSVIYEKQQAKIDQDKQEKARVESEGVGRATNSHQSQYDDHDHRTNNGRFHRILGGRQSASKGDSDDHAAATGAATSSSTSALQSWMHRTLNQLKLVEVQSPFYTRYLNFLSVSLLYTALSVPYFVTFGRDRKMSTISLVVLVLDMATDVVFAYDIWFKRNIVETVSSREFYEHRITRDRADVVLDVLTLLPLDYLFSSVVSNSAVLRVNRFIKLRQLTHTISEIHRFSMSYEVNRLKLLALYYFIICYWTACAYFGLTIVVGFSAEWNSSLPVEYFNSQNHADEYNVGFAFHQFLRCFYYSATMYTGVGLVYEPHAILDFLVLYLVSVFGVFVMGYVIGEASTLCIYLIQNEVEFKINQMNIMEFLVRKRMDRSVHSRVHMYLSYWWSTQQGVAYQSILEQLPPRIRSQAYIQMARLSLARFSMRYIRPLCDESMGLDPVMHSIVHRLVFEGYPAGESVIVQGNIGQTMYFVSKGNLITASPTPDFCSTRYVDGQFFGEEGFLASSFCRHSVVTLRACDLLALSSIDFLVALSEHPRFAECVGIAWDTIANHNISLKDLHGASDVGNFVYNMMERKKSGLRFVRIPSIDRAEVMFRHFLRLFVRQMPDNMVYDDGANMQQHDTQALCQHCEDVQATVYCNLCPQALCDECSRHIHENTHFAQHVDTITKLHTATLLPPESPRKSSGYRIMRIVQSLQVLKNDHVVMPSHLAVDGENSDVSKRSKRSIQITRSMLVEADTRKGTLKDLQRANSRRGSRKLSMPRSPPPIAPGHMIDNKVVEEFKRDLLNRPSLVLNPAPSEPRNAVTDQEASDMTGNAVDHDGVSKPSNKVAPLALGEHPSAGDSFTLRRGKLSWEVTYTKTGTIDPDAFAMLVWEVGLLLSVLVQAWTIPFLVCFEDVHPELQHGSWLMGITCAFDIPFAVDMVVQSRTGYYDMGNLIRNAKSSRRRYLRSWTFVVDAIAIVPLSLIFWSSRGVFLVNKLIRLRKLPVYTLAFDKNGFKSGEANDRHTMKLLCPSISKDIKFSLLKTMTSNVPFFKCCSAVVIRALIDLMETQSLPTNFIVSKVGDQEDGMYIVQSGVLVVLLNDAKVREILIDLFKYHPLLRAYPQVESEIMNCVKTLLAERDADANSAETKQNKKVRRGVKAIVSWSTLRQHLGSAKNHMVTQTSVAESTTKSPLVIAKPAPTHQTGSRQSSTHFIEFKKSMHVSPEEVTTMYNTVTVPMVNAFQLVGYPSHILTLNTVADAVLWVDMYLNFNLSYIVEAEHILDTTMCAQRYWRSTFRFDLLCAFPWWIFCPSHHALVRFTRLIRCFWLHSNLHELEHFVSIDSRKRIVLLGIGLFMCYHIAGCMAHSLTFVLGYGTHAHGWLPPNSLYLRPVWNITTGALAGYNYLDRTVLVAVDDPLVNHILLKQYLRALQYGAVCLTSLGLTLEPETLWEFVLAIVLMLSGMLVISIVIDEVQKRVTASDIDHMEFLSLRSRIMHFLHKQNVPGDIHRRVASSMDFWWSVHRGANINDLLKEVPNSIRREIIGSICAPALNVIEQVIGINPPLLDRACGIFLDNVVIQLFGQGEVMYHRGDSADAMYILLVGDIVLVANTRSSKAMPLRYVKPGEIFGCSSLYMGNVGGSTVHVENAIARTACVVALVDRPTIQVLNAKYPSFCTTFLRKDQKLLAEHRAMTRLLAQTELAALSGQKSNGTIDPDSTFSIVWETLLFVGMVFQVVRVPYLIAFGFRNPGLDFRDVVSMVVETLFVVDVALKMRTGYYSFGNKWFNTNKLLRLFQLPARFDMLEQHYFKVSIPIRVFKLVFYIFLLAHFIGCTWYNFASDLASVMGYGGNSQFGMYPWLPDKDMDIADHHESEIYKYARVLFWGLGLLLGFYKGEYPQLVAEYVFTIVVQTIGVFLLAYVVGNLLDIVQVTEGNNRIFYSNLNFVRKLTTYFAFSDDVQTKIQHFYFYRLFHSIHEEHILTKCLPQSLVADIRLFLLTPMLNKVPFFQHEAASSNITRSLVRQLTQVLVTRHEVVCRQHEIGVEMYFVFTGCLEVYVASDQHSATTAASIDGMSVSSRGTKVTEIAAGSFFGEKSLFSDQRRNASIEAKTFCTLYRLSRTHLESVFAQHPEWKSKVLQIVARMYEAQEKVYRGRLASEATTRKMHDNPPPLHRSPHSKPPSGCSIHNLSSAFEDDHVRTVRVVPWAHRWRRHMLDVVTDMVFGCDIWFKFHVVETTSSREFYEHRYHYDSKGVTLDIVAILPLDYAFAAFTTHAYVWRLNRFLKLRQLTYVIGELQRFSMSYEMNRLKTLALYYYVIGYWTACAYFGLTTVVGFSSSWNSSLPIQYFNVRVCPVQPPTPICGTDISIQSTGHADVLFSIHQYARCFFYAANFYTGSGRVYEPVASLQFAFHSVLSVFGVFVMGYVIGEGSTLCIYLIQNEVDFKINQMHVMDFLSRKRVDVVLHSRIHKYMSYWWTFQNGVPYQTILDQLPRRIRGQANIDLARKSLSRFALRYIRPLVHHNTLMGGVDPIMHSIAHRLVYEGYPTGESVIVQGNIGHTMYFVSTGALMTVSTNPTFVSVRYDDSQYFGDDGLLDSTTRHYSVVTLRACDLLALSAVDFLAALHEHPRLLECCTVATGVALRLSKQNETKHNDPQGRQIPKPHVGRLVCDELVRKAADLKYLKVMEFEVANAMFGNFVGLFMCSEDGAIAMDNTNVHPSGPLSAPMCQYCEDRTADRYCPLCHQVLCAHCTCSIHDNSYYSYHTKRISMLHAPPTSDLPPTPQFPTSPKMTPHGQLKLVTSHPPTSSVYDFLYKLLQQRQGRVEPATSHVIHVSNEMISGSLDVSPSSKSRDVPRRHVKHIRHHHHSALSKSFNLHEIGRLNRKKGPRCRVLQSQGSSARESKPLDMSAAARRRASIDANQHLNSLLASTTAPLPIQAAPGVQPGAIEQVGAIPRCLAQRSNQVVCSDDPSNTHGTNDKQPIFPRSPQNGPVKGPAVQLLGNAGPAHDHKNVHLAPLAKNVSVDAEKQEPSIDTARSNGRVAPTMLADTDTMDSISDIRRGKLTWEILYKSSSTFDPDSSKVQLWHTFLLALVLYDAWLVPLLVSFSQLNPAICRKTWLQMLATAGEVFFVVDVYVHMHSRFYLFGDPIRDVKFIRRYYLMSWGFPLDLLALVPINTIIPALASTQPCGLGLLNKLLRLRKVPAYTLTFDKVFARYYKLCKVVKAVVVVYFSCHVMACVYASFGKLVDPSKDEDAWKMHDFSTSTHERRRRRLSSDSSDDQHTSQLLTEYLAALFWYIRLVFALVCSQVGVRSLGLVSKCVEGQVPRTLMQTLFMLAVMISGFLLFVYICGTLFMISKCDANSTQEFDAKRNQLRYILSYHQVPMDIQSRAVEYFENGFKSGEVNDRHTMQLLCPSIAKDIKYAALKDMVTGVPFFKYCRAAFIRALIDLMETQSVPTNYIVCRKDEEGEDMYFVQSGVLVILVDDIKVFLMFRQVQFVGSIVVF
ncbi:hypothetical protein DYB36_000253 [Aphanomyces astaci]|uniref:Cyclic nucleotide-binding domain-containing protein n=2 Tax=Aphanomyces astaci TaxID=112090 RepID=A0A397A6B5_APHAT|nr:hypothetical protein DYB36_000253 [Aphanomyces astaci]